MIQLKDNTLSKGLINLKNLFYCDDAKNKKQKIVVDKGDYVDLEIGDGRKLKVSKGIPQKDKERFISWCDKYKGVIT